MQQQPKPRWPLIVVSALFVMVAAIGVYAFLWDREEHPDVIVREDPVADLLGWIPATEETRTSFAVWTPDRAENSTSAIAAASGKSLALSPSPWELNSPAVKRGVYTISESHVTGWVSAGADDPTVVMQGTFSWGLSDSPDSSESYRGATIYSPSDDQDVEVATAVLGQRVIVANSVDQLKAAIDAATGKRDSLAEDKSVSLLLQTVDPTSALMIVDVAKQAVACAGGDESTVDPSGQYVAVAYGRIGEGGEPRTLVATSFESDEEAASAEPAYELGWQDGYVLAGNSGAPIANFATVNHVSQSGNLLIAELVDGREDSWTRAAIRFAQPVCEAVSESLPDAIAATPDIDEPSALNRALTSLPDPGMDGATLAVDLAAASQAVGEFAPEDQDIRAEEIEAWLAALGPIPSFDAFPNDATKLARWPETLGISLGSISAISEIHTSSEEETVAVLIGTWDPDVVADHLSQLGFPRTNWGEASIYTFTGNLEDPIHEFNRAAGVMWSNVGIYGDRIFVSPSSSRLREVLDIARGEQSAPDPPDGVYLRDRILAGNTDVTMLEIAGREFMNDLCVDLGATGVAPDWYGTAALWKSSVSGGTGEMLIVPGDDQSIADAQQTFDRQITRNRTLISADSEPSGGPFGEMFGYQEMRQDTLADGTTVLVATFSPSAGESPDRFFIESVEGCRFGST